MLNYLQIKTDVLSVDLNVSFRAGSAMNSKKPPIIDDGQESGGYNSAHYQIMTHRFNHRSTGD